MRMVSHDLFERLRLCTIVPALFSRRKWMQGQFLMMIASGLVGKDEKFAKLEAFLWRPPVRAVEILRPANLQLVAIRTCFGIIKKTQNYKVDS